MQIDVLTPFPEWFDWMRRPRHLANAALTADLELRCFSYRDHTPLSHGQIDDAPYGGGPGMVVRVDVVAAALEAIYGCPAERVRERRRVIALSPRGTPLDDALVRRLAEESALTLLSARYEGFDERIHAYLASETVSLGPFVLSGGEIAAMAIVDAVGRRLPGALGNVASLEAESFSATLGGRTEHPHYTRPAGFRGWRVPEVLLSGDHGAIAAWRERQLGVAPGVSADPSPAILPDRSAEEEGRR